MHLFFYVLFILFAICPAQAHEQEQPTIAFFVHGLKESGEKQSKQLLKKDDGSPYLLAMPCRYFDFACSTDSWWRMNFWRCDLGQEGELKQMHEALQEVRAEFPNARIVLVGISRGASTIINYCANYPSDDVSACVLESPYDHIESLLGHHYRLKALGSYARWMFKLLFSKCDLEHGKFPINQIEKIKRDIPMLFVSVENDRSIPLASIQKLIQLRKEQGHQHVHHLHLTEGRHGKLMSGPQAEYYQYIGHAFFARYGLPHNSTYAKIGAPHIYETPINITN